MLHEKAHEFGEIIYAYSREQAIEDGVLVDVSDRAKEAGFIIPTAVTEAVWSNYVHWTGADTDKQTIQDEEGRLWDVLWMLIVAIKSKKTKPSDNCIRYELNVVPRDGKSKKAKRVHLKAMIGAGDNGEPVITIMLPNED